MKALELIDDSRALIRIKAAFADAAFLSMAAINFALGEGASMAGSEDPAMLVQANVSAISAWNHRFICSKLFWVGPSTGSVAFPPTTFMVALAGS
jgi:hypothetical protein